MSNWINRGLAVIALALASSNAAAQVFDNASVITLHQAGLGNEAIVAKIRTLPCNYQTSTEQLVALKRAGIGDDVIVAMVERCAGASHAQGISNATADPLAAHSPGIYLDKDGGAGRQLIMLRPSNSPSVKVTGNGSLLFPRLAKLIVPQPKAQLALAVARPFFWFYFNAADSKVDDFGSAGISAAQSPNEFSLVRFRQDAGNRQFVVGRAEPYVQVVGVDPKNTIPFAIKEVGDSIFKVEMQNDLPPGEYAFILPGQRGVFRIYDFSISDSPKS